MASPRRAQSGPDDGVESAPRLRPRAWGLAVGLLALALLAGLMLWANGASGVGAERPEPGRSQGKSSGDWRRAPACEVVAPTPPRRHWPWPIGAGLLILAVGGLAVSARVAGRRRAPRWLKDRWSQAFSRLALPRAYTLGALVEPHTTALPVRELASAFRGAGFEQITVLHDQSRATRPWAAQIERFVGELIVTGLDVRVWTFDEQPDVVFDAHGEGRALSHLEAEGVVLYLGAAHSGLQMGEAAARTGLGRFAAGLWLDPVCDPRWWGEGVDLGLPRLPLDAAGLAAVGPALRGERIEPVAAPEPVDPEDLRRLDRLMGLLPQPELSLAFDLLRRIEPRTSVATAAAWLQMGGEREARIGLRFTGEMLALLRTLLDEQMRAAQPPEGSAAALRWRRDRALLDLEIGDEAQQAAAVDSLASLALGALGDELLPELDRLCGRYPSLRPVVAQGESYQRPPPPFAGQPPRFGRPGAGAWALAGACLFALVVAVIGRRPRVLPMVALEINERNELRVVGLPEAQLGLFSERGPLGAQTVGAHPVALSRFDLNPADRCVFVFGPGPGGKYVISNGVGVGQMNE